MYIVPLEEEKDIKQIFVMNFMKTQEKDFRVFNVKNTEDYTVIYVKMLLKG